MSHEKLETNIGWMAMLIAVVISFGGLAEIVPLMYQAEAIQPLPGVTPESCDKSLRGTDFSGRPHSVKRLRKLTK